MNTTHLTKCLPHSPWNEGFKDKLAGYGMNECPYNAGTKWYFDWIEGWLDADANGGYL